MNNNSTIIECLCRWMEQNHRTELDAVQAAEILDRAGILKDSAARPGKPLRDKLWNGEIPHAYQTADRRWHIPYVRSGGVSVKKVSKPALSTPQETLSPIITPKTLTEKSRFKNVKDLSSSYVPDVPGLYAIRVKNPDKLPKEFRNELKNRNDNLLYIGQASQSLRKRLWEEELHARRHATFFRTIGAVLGYLPPKGSLKGKKNQNNYRFSADDNAKIIKWIEENLMINFMECRDNITPMEKELIKVYTPLMNIQDNPTPFGLLQELRNKCRETARS
ncbi:MAG: hypothetical protein NC048_04185 [Bacteroides sp.]|nr:hypothetical protein [Ruminococcus flavefaciens]MCM1554674.1 hypothetical protein [Bacteroides sp.]